jgi:hypothetical protein
VDKRILKLVKSGVVVQTHWWKVLVMDGWWVVLSSMGFFGGSSRSVLDVPWR